MTVAEAFQQVVADTQAAMLQASRAVLGGFELRTDAEIVCYPDRYFDEGGRTMWQKVIGVLEETERRQFGDTNACCVTTKAENFEV